MQALRRIGWVGFAAAASVLVAGLLLAVGSAIAAGDWLLARQPWIGVGLTLLVVGLAATAVFALLLDVVEPLGRWRLLALPPVLLVASFWAFVLVVGVPTSGGPDFDVGTILYSAPQMLVVLLIATILIALPLVVVRPGRVSGSCPE
jgi:hypothetical protein